MDSSCVVCNRGSKIVRFLVSTDMPHVFLIKYVCKTCGGIVKKIDTVAIKSWHSVVLLCSSQTTQTKTIPSLTTRKPLEHKSLQVSKLEPRLIQGGARQNTSAIVPTEPRFAHVVVIKRGSTTAAPCVDNSTNDACACKPMRQLVPDAFGEVRTDVHENQQSWPRVNPRLEFGELSL